MTPVRTLISIEGDMGVDVPCFLFKNMVTTTIPVDGVNRSIRIRLPLDEARVRSYDGTWAVVEAKQRNGPSATLRMHRVHLGSLGLPTDIVIDHAPTMLENMPAKNNSSRIIASLMLGGAMILGVVAAYSNRRR